MYIKIKCLRGNTVPKITTNLHEACSSDAVNCSTANRWFKRFQEGRKLTEDDVSTGCPSITIGDWTQSGRPLVAKYRTT